MSSMLSQVAARSTARRIATRSPALPTSRTIATHLSHRPFAPRCRIQAATLQCIQQQRHISAQQFRKAIKKSFRDNPFQFSLGTVFIIITIGICGIALPSYYHQYIIGVFHNFPEPVAKELRKAIYYSKIDWQPQQALKFYKAGIEKADEIGFDPFSDEIIGTKVAISSVYEKWGNFQAACDVLEIIRRDCLAYVQEVGDKHWNDGRRTKMLRYAVEASIKLGEMYALPHVLNRAAAEERLVWATETVMKEQRRRDEEGEKEGEGPWFTNEEFGATCESLAHNYEAKSQHYLSTPLFVKALSLSPPQSCHSVILMNNIATSMAQQSPVPKTLPPRQNAQPGIPQATLPKSPAFLPPAKASAQDREFPTIASPDRAQLLQYARRWAESARSLSGSIEGNGRTEECDMGCAVATHNLGEFAEMEGLVEEARKWYGEARELAGKLRFEEGVANAEKGLERIGTRTGT